MREPSGSDGARPLLLLLHKQIKAVNKNQAGVCKGEEEGGIKAKWGGEKKAKKGQKIAKKKKRAKKQEFVLK